MWSGQSSNIPSGWALCNGQNGTPNLQDRFIVGAGNQYTVGATGGVNEVTLTTAQMPSHNHGASHTLSTSQTGSHNHSITSGTDRLGVEYDVSPNYYAVEYDRYGGGSTTGNAGSHTHSITGSITIGTAGSNASHENRPPYYALCFIMKL